MLGTDLIVLLGTVLEIVAVAVLHEPLPFSGHLGGSGHEVVFGTEIVGIIGLVDAPDIVEETFERLSNAILIKKGRESLVELMESLDAGEDPVGAMEAPAHGVGHLHLLKGGIEEGSMGINELTDMGIGKQIDGQLRTSGIIGGLHHAPEE